MHQETDIVRHITCGLSSSRLFTCISGIGIYNNQYRWPRCSPRASGANEERLAKVYAAGLFAYRVERLLRELAHLPDQALAVHIAQLREYRARLLTIHGTDRQAVRTGPLRRREWCGKEGVLVVFFQNEGRPGELVALSVGLVADVEAKANPPDFGVVEKGPCSVRCCVSRLFNTVRFVERFCHISARYHVRNMAHLFGSWSVVPYPPRF